MIEILKYLKARYVSEKAQGIVEYALILAFVVILAIALTSGGGLAEKVKSVFTSVGSQLDKTSTGN